MPALMAEISSSSCVISSESSRRRAPPEPMPSAKNLRASDWSVALDSRTSSQPSSIGLLRSRSLPIAHGVLRRAGSRRHPRIPPAAPRRSHCPRNGTASPSARGSPRQRRRSAPNPGLRARNRDGAAYHSVARTRQRVQLASDRSTGSGCRCGARVSSRRLDVQTSVRYFALDIAARTLSRPPTS